MYWYYKYPLLALLLIVLTGVGLKVWDTVSVSSKQDDQTTEGQTEENNSSTDTESANEANDSDAPEDSAETDVASDVTDSTQPTEADVSDSPQPEQQESADYDKDAVKNRLRTAREQLQNNQYRAARKLARKAMGKLPEQMTPFSSPWDKGAEIISKANTHIFKSSIPVPEKTKYVVQSGDTLSSIAEKFNTTVTALQLGNDIPPARADIYPNEVLYIYQGDWQIKVFKEDFRLLLFNGDKLFKQYKAGIGRQDRTPVGTFQIKNKLKEPDWTRPGEVIPYGSPDNILGTHWMGIEPTDDTDKKHKGYGIHGTWKPESVGEAVSNGCIRMKNEDVEELFAVVRKGTPVIIKENSNGDGS